MGECRRHLRCAVPSTMILRYSGRFPTVFGPNLLNWCRGCSTAGELQLTKSSPSWSCAPSRNTWSVQVACDRARNSKLQFQFSASDDRVPSGREGRAGCRPCDPQRAPEGSSLLSVPVNVRTSFIELFRARICPQLTSWHWRWPGAAWILHVRTYSPLDKLVERRFILFAFAASVSLVLGRKFASERCLKISALLAGLAPGSAA